VGVKIKRGRSYFAVKFSDRIIMLSYINEKLSAETF